MQDKQRKIKGEREREREITHIEITSGITFIITPIITSRINSCEKKNLF